MNRFVLGLVFTLASVGILSATPCASDSLTTYLNGGSLYSCTEDGAATDSVSIIFNHDLLPSYVGLSILGGTSVLPDFITVVPGAPGLSFQGEFSVGDPILSSEAELVHFLMTSTTPILSTTFTLQNPIVTVGGGLGLGTGLIIGQELVCVGGTFTSLPVGIVTSVLSGVLGGADQFGCNGVALIGTAAASVGPLDTLSGLLGLPSLVGLTDTAVIQFNPADTTTIDVIKLQALFSVLGGTASTGGFGNTFEVAPVPEPATAAMFLLGGTLLLGSISLKRRRNSR